MDNVVGYSSTRVLWYFGIHYSTVRNALKKNGSFLFKKKLVAISSSKELLDLKFNSANVLIPLSI